MIQTIRSSKLDSKCWIAEITGIDSVNDLARNFLEPKTIEHEHHYKLLIDKIYEISAEGDRWFVLCHPTPNGGAATAKLTREQVNAWAKAQDIIRAAARP